MKTILDIKSIIQFYFRLFPWVSILIATVPILMSILFIGSLSDFYVDQIEYTGSKYEYYFLAYTIYMSFLAFFLGVVLNFQKENSIGLSIPKGPKAHFLVPLLILAYSFLVPFLFNLELSFASSFFEGLSFYFSFFFIPLLLFVISYRYWEVRKKLFLLVISYFLVFHSFGVLQNWIRYQDLLIVQLSFLVVLIGAYYLGSQKLKKEWALYSIAVTAFVLVFQILFLFVGEKNYKKSILAVHFSKSQVVVDSFEKVATSEFYWQSEKEQGAEKYIYYIQSSEFVEKLLPISSKKKILGLILSGNYDFYYRHTHDFRVDFMHPFGYSRDGDWKVDFYLKNWKFSKEMCDLLPISREYPELLPKLISLECRKFSKYNKALSIIRIYMPNSSEEYDVRFRELLTKSKFDKSTRDLWVSTFRNVFESSNQLLINDGSGITEKFLSIYETIYKSEILDLLKPIVNSNLKDFESMLSNLGQSEEVSEKKLNYLTWYLLMMSENGIDSRNSVEKYSNLVEVLKEKLNEIISPEGYSIMDTIKKPRRAKEIFKLKRFSVFQEASR